MLSIGKEATVLTFGLGVKDGTVKNAQFKGTHTTVGGKNYERGQESEQKLPCMID